MLMLKSLQWPTAQSSDLHTQFPVSSLPQAYKSLSPSYLKTSLDDQGQSKSTPTLTSPWTLFSDIQWLALLALWLFKRAIYDRLLN